MTILTGLSSSRLRWMYSDLKKTDAEIAKFFGVDRATISHLRKKYNIKTRKTVGEIGEEMAIKEFKSRGYEVKNMNEVDRLHPFDILLENTVRVEVKTSSLTPDNRFVFTLTEKPTNENKESDTRIKLANGRTKKLFRKTCDLLICVGLEPEGDCHFFIVKSEDIRDDMQTMSVSFDPFSDSPMNKQREDWDLVEKIVRLRQQSDR